MEEFEKNEEVEDTISDTLSMDEFGNIGVVIASGFPKAIPTIEPENGE